MFSMRQSLTERVVMAIKVEMVRKETSTARLAVAMGRDYRWLHRRLIGDAQFWLEDVALAAAALGVPVSKLITGDEVHS